MTDRADQMRPGFAATCWTIAKFAACCAAGFAAFSAITGLGLVVWLSTAAP